MKNKCRSGWLKLKKTLHVRGNMSLCSGKFNVELTDWAVARGSTSSDAEDSRSEYSE